MTNDHSPQAWGNPTPAYIPCLRPQSFYDIVESLSKRTTSEWVLHRIANLLRKYEQAEEKCSHLTARVEWHPQGLPSFALEDKHLSKVAGTEVTSECMTLTVFAAEVNDKTLHEVSPDKLLVYCVIKRNRGIGDVSGNVWEAIVRPYLPLNNYVNGIQKYEREIGGRKFEINGIYFSQQNGTSAKCAQSALAMLLRAMGKKGPHGEEPTPADVAAMVPKAIGDGLTLNQVVQVLRTYNLEPWAIDFEDPTARNVDYRSLVHAGLESGLPVLLSFITRDRTTGKIERHVVTVLGHTLNTDTWVAEAEFGYGRQSEHKYHPSYDWCTHWIVNDDNLGMHYCLQANRLTSPWSDWDVSNKDTRWARICEWLLRVPRRRWIQGHLKEFHVFGVVVPLPSRGPEDIKGAEIKTLQLLRNLIAKFKLGKTAPKLLTLSEAQWLSRLEGRLAPKHPGPGPILRSRLVDRNEYIRHLREDGDWNHKLIDAALIAEVEAALPEPPKQFWMTEYTLADLFTANRRKLGEVLWEPKWADLTDKNDMNGLLAARVPGMLIMYPKDGSARKARITNCWSHVPLLAKATHGNRF